ncbi:MAG: RNA 2',3'-cyclic phosphodiesterase [Candidatus Omnitrophica bacterium CG22_combo_CG10-13_8_21_14_all_43_16]|nr:MAG: RNA 2',3'-cyclic phosphodiesterase [Candidatus Omnitrophica bacterium CG22_combo_CG10-13_8_21_14_all_43_16]
MMNNVIRAFIAVEIDNQTRQKISDLVSCLKKTGSDAKWITEDQMHLTLKFLGNIGWDKVQKISETLSVISDSFKSFKIGFSAIGAFPNLDHPRVIWLGIDKGQESLKILNGKIEAGLEKAGFAKEDREFSPHLTLARIRSPKNISNLVKLIGEKNLTPAGELLIDKLTLFQSALTPKGAVYTALLQKSLQN